NFRFWRSPLQAYCSSKRSSTGLIQIAAVLYAADHTYRSGIGDRDCRISIARMIEDICRRQFKTQTRLLAEADALGQSCIKHRIARSNDDALRRSTKTSRLRRRKRRGVEPSADGTLIRRQVRVAQHIRPQSYGGRCPA